MAKATQAEIKESHERLTELLGDTERVSVIFRGVSSSGLTRWLTLLITSPDGSIIDISRHAARVLGLPYSDRRDGVTVSGAGMDMGFHLVSSLSMKLFGDHYKLKHHWL